MLLVKKCLACDNSDPEKFDEKVVDEALVMTCLQCGSTIVTEEVLETEDDIL